MFISDLDYIWSFHSKTVEGRRHLSLYTLRATLFSSSRKSLFSMLHVGRHAFNVDSNATKLVNYWLIGQLAGISSQIICAKAA